MEYRLEKRLHWAVCDYIRLKYPKVFFNTDLSGVWMQGKKGMAVEAKKARKQEGFPDLFIAHSNSKFHGLYIEIKTIKGTCFKVDGSLRKSYLPGGKKHNQVQWLKHLKSQGNLCWFGVGYNNCKDIIDNYMSIQ